MALAVCNDNESALVFLHDHSWGSPTVMVSMRLATIGLGGRGTEGLGLGEAKRGESQAEESDDGSGLHGEWTAD